MRFGVQSFGTLKSNKDDLPALFKKIRGMGYQLFEPCISFFEIPEFENIWDYEKYNEYDRMLKEAGLKVLSCHIFSKNLFKDSEKIKRLISEYGIKQFVLKTPEDVSDENLNKNCA